jgi:hypothetical protein
MLASGMHPTLAGAILAMFIPTRPPPDVNALVAQASAIIAAEAARGGEVLRHGPSVPAIRALDAIHDRLESPADRLLRNAGARSSYLVLPLLALANAGVAVRMDTFGGRERLMAAILAGLVVGKPFGIMLASALAVSLKVAVKPREYSWAQLAGAGALAGTGFHHLVVHRRRGFPGGGRFPRRQDRGLRRLDSVRRHRRDRAFARRAKCAALAGLGPSTDDDSRCPRPARSSAARMRLAYRPCPVAGDSVRGGRPSASRSCPRRVW